MSEAPAMSAVFPHPLPIDLFFGLDRSEYLTVPRSVLASMSPEWQEKFVALLNELDGVLNWRPTEGRYWVELRDSKGRIAHDPLRDYRHVRLAASAFRSGFLLVGSEGIEGGTIVLTETLADGTVRAVATIRDVTNTPKEPSDG